MAPLARMTGTHAWSWGHHNLCMICNWKSAGGDGVVPVPCVLVKLLVGSISKRRLGRWGLCRQQAFGQGVCIGPAEQREWNGNNWALPGCRRALFPSPVEAMNKELVMFWATAPLPITVANQLIALPPSVLWESSGTSRLPNLQVGFVLLK